MQVETKADLVAEAARMARRREMAPENCLHPNRVRGVVALDFSRPEAPDHPAYSGAVSVGVCEEWTRRTVRRVSPRALRLAKNEELN